MFYLTKLGKQFFFKINCIGTSVYKTQNRLRKKNVLSYTNRIIRVILDNSKLNQSRTKVDQG